jgi:large subunit ribosomal protein L24
MLMKRNDEVEVISGEYKGKRGKVLKVFPTEQRLIVEGVNFISRHMRPSQTMPQGGIVKREAPIHISNVMLVCPKTNQRTRIKASYLESGDKRSRNKVRLSVKSGEIVPDQSK